MHRCIAVKYMDLFAFFPVDISDEIGNKKRGLLPQHFSKWSQRPEGSAEANQQLYKLPAAAQQGKNTQTNALKNAGRRSYSVLICCHVPGFCSLWNSGGCRSTRSLVQLLEMEPIPQRSADRWDKNSFCCRSVRMQRQSLDNKLIKYCKNKLPYLINTWKDFNITRLWKNVLVELRIDFPS